MRGSTITSKGQVTIPKEVREALGLKEHDQVIFVVDGKKAIMRPVHAGSVMELYGALKSEIPYPGREAEREAVRQAVARHVVLGSDTES